MRILRFMGYPIHNFSTLEIMMLKQAQTLRDFGHEVELVFDGVRRDSAAVEARQFAPEIKIHFDLPNLMEDKGVVASVRYFRAVFKKLSAQHYDIVHLYFDPSARILNQLARFFPKTIFIRTIGSTPIMRGKHAWLTPIKKKKWCFDLSHISAVICVGQHISDLFASYGLPKQRLHVIPNATDIARFAPNREIKPVHPIFRLGFMGRLDGVKNIELMIQGAYLLRHQYQLDDFSLTIYGEGYLRETLASLIEERGLSDYVRLAGRANDVAVVLRDEVDLYVQASHNEGCPAAVIEAMASGVPVLLSDIPGHRQVATDGLHGVFFTAGSAEDFAQKLVNLKNNPEQAKLMGHAARQHVVDEFSIEAWIAKELALYTRLHQEFHRA